MVVELVEHPFPPFFGHDSRILILGSLPSVRSREEGFFYGHPQNRFWRILAALFEEEVPSSIEEKSALLRRNHVALWDVVQSCSIRGSSDASIKDVVPTELFQILTGSRVDRIFCNGGVSGRLYHKYQERRTGMPAVILPSSSPANAAWSLEKLIQAWGKLLDPASFRS